LFVESKAFQACWWRWTSITEQENRLWSWSS